MPDVALARREGVELIRTGTWGASTGSWTPTKKDILAAVEAMKCPAVGKPVLTIGHLDERFTPRAKTEDGEPGIGWVDNLRAGEDGELLLGDYVGVPAWIDQIMASAWPKRSIEGKYNYRCALNHRHDFALDAVSLLGTTRPAIPTLRSLNDVAELYGVDIAAAEDHTGDSVYAVVAAEAEHTGAMIALIPTAEDAARLAVDGGEPAEELHVTLAYLGEAAALGARGQQDVIDGVSTAANGLPQFEAEAFALNCFNPPGAQRDDGKDRDTCIVLGLSGDVIDAVHSLVEEALREALWSIDVPPPHRPWHAHMTLEYTDDLSKLATFTDRIGPIRFDRIRVAMGGQITDIPLIPPEEDDTVAASAATVLDRLAPIRTRIAALEQVAASEPPDIPAPELPAAEPEQEITSEPNEEDIVSTELSGLRSRLGLPDDADLTAIEAKVDQIKADAEKTPEPTPEMVAASAAATEKATKAEAEKDELRKEVQILASQMKSVSDELAATKAEKAATVKASVIDAAVQAGKIKPADKGDWERDYDESPGAVTRVLASIAPGTAVPVMASGITGGPEPVLAGAGTFSDADYNRVFGITEEV
uniref:phage protease n=1 Tax=Paractinoplanes polyasparticus TaxID=2856853 RepID=UPI001C844353|nr:phage protease [Actinoplanes polyasparticus]